MGERSKLMVGIYESLYRKGRFAGNEQCVEARSHLLQGCVNSKGAPFEIDHQKAMDAAGRYTADIQTLMAKYLVTNLSESQTGGSSGATRVRSTTKRKDTPSVAQTTDVILIGESPPGAALARVPRYTLAHACTHTHHARTHERTHTHGAMELSSSLS